MSARDLVLEENLDKLCIPIGTAVSAKFRGAFCEALVNSVDKIILCRIQLVDNKKTIKVNAEDIIGYISANSKVQVKIHHDITNGVILKIIDNSIYHVVFNDGDTGKLRRNQLVLKGDRHYKESESLDQHPLTNPEHFTKAVIYEKRLKDKSDAEDDEFDNDDQKSGSEESLTTVSSNKTRRQQTHTSSPSVGTAGSSLTAKTSDEVNKTPINKVTKFKKHANTKYLIGCLVIVNRFVRKLASLTYDKPNKKHKSFAALIVSPSSCIDEDSPDVKSTQCVVKSFMDNLWYIVYKRDLELVVKRDMLIKHKESDPEANIYVEKCLLFLDAKIFPDLWDSDKLLYSAEYPAFDSTDRSNMKSNKSRVHSSLTNSLSSLDSSSSDERNPDNDKSDSSDQEYQNTKDEWVARFYGFWEDKGSPINHGLEIQGAEVDIYRLYELVKEFGGYQKVNTSVRWPHIYYLLKLPNRNSDNYQRLQTLYKKFIYPYVDMKKKLGTFEQSRNRKHNEKPTNSNQKARPLLSARERREYVRQFSRKSVEAHSVSSHSVCERPIDHGISGDEIGTNSLIEDTSQLSQCSSSPKPVFDRTIDGDGECKSIVTPCVNRLSPGTIVSVAYGDKKVYKAKIIQQHSPENKSLKSQSVDSKTTSKQPRVSLDNLSNADSASSVNNDFKSEIDSSTFYKVHYIGWNSRHDEIISPERILGIISDTGMDNQSTCSSSCRQKPTISDTEQTLETVNPIPNDTCNLYTDLIISETMESMNSQCLGSDHIVSEENLVESMETDEIINNEQIQEPVDVITPEVKSEKSINLKRRRSRSVCFYELENFSIKKLETLPESRIIASLNLYKVGDKMPMPPKRLKHEEIIKNNQMFEELKEDIKTSSPCYEQIVESPDKHPCDVNFCPNTCAKNESITSKDETEDIKDYFQIERNRSPSFSNDSLSDASTLPFRLEQDQSLFYISPNEDSEKSPPSVMRPAGKTGNKRGRKPILRPDKKPPGNLPITKQRENRVDVVEIESTSSQHSGSAHGRRVTRSLRTISDQNTIDDNSMQFEDDSQTSQDDSAFQLPTVLPIENRSSSMLPLASGTPTSHSHKGRRPKSRRKNRNSLSTSSADGGYQDSNGENTAGSVILTNCDIPSINQSVVTDNNLCFVSSTHRPSGRPFQRLHPSLIPVGLEKLPPEERVKILESVIRQTHFNFLDVKDKIKYVEKQILEIRAGRANGHGIESDEDKFR